MYMYVYLTSKNAHIDFSLIVCLFSKKNQDINRENIDSIFFEGFPFLIGSI